MASRTDGLDRRTDQTFKKPDVTKHAHVSEIKDPARRTNNNDYDPQICRHLDQDEKLRHFAIAMTLKSHCTYHDPNDRPGDVPEEEEDEGAIDCDKWEQDDLRTALLEEMNHTHVTMNYFSKARQIVAARDEAISHPPRTFIAGGTAIHLNYNPSHTGVSVDDVATDFNILDLHVALSEFLLCDVRERGAVYEVGGPRRRPLIDVLQSFHLTVFNYGILFTFSKCLSTILASTSFVLNYLLATVMTSIPEARLHG
ncbi:uncharacterized protein F5147DRAFT_777535 [Suillus discolor]|uniref:DUF6830 domain-containing protein n=1 Tax=Suillus discolor TaxID=1912936 RepID=A0A9P7JQ04_9AGAM|nr:uncharacterized protein F5147DRAFT_777535 [Suillus discolor]KAG2098690.1 hypothetical protein F5147DRAFT_777535 [Suillus discolor]